MFFSQFVGIIISFNCQLELQSRCWCWHVCFVHFHSMKIWQPGRRREVDNSQTPSQSQDQIVKDWSIIMSYVLRYNVNATHYFYLVFLYRYDRQLLPDYIYKRLTELFKIRDWLLSITISQVKWKLKMGCSENSRLDATIYNIAL